GGPAWRRGPALPSGPARGGFFARPPVTPHEMFAPNRAHSPTQCTAAIAAAPAGAGIGRSACASGCVGDGGSAARAAGAGISAGPAVAAGSGSDLVIRQGRVVEHDVMAMQAGDGAAHGIAACAA